jgi:toxin ParE1/3/4
LTHTVIFSPEAEAQLAGIFRYIAAEASPSIAKQFTDDIVTYCETLSDFPDRGTKRHDLRIGMRVAGFRRRVAIAFVVEPAKVIIAGIFHGGQDYEKALSADGER